MKYQIEISQQDRLLFKVEIDNINRHVREETIALILQRFPIEEGYTRHLLYSDNETRYLKSTQTGIELIAAKPSFQSLGLK